MRLSVLCRHQTQATMKRMQKSNFFGLGDVAGSHQKFPFVVFRRLTRVLAARRKNLAFVILSRRRGGTILPEKPGGGLREMFCLKENT